jgi:hypothetical protein
LRRYASCSSTSGNEDINFDYRGFEFPVSVRAAYPAPLALECCPSVPD